MGLWCANWEWILAPCSAKAKQPNKCKTKKASVSPCFPILEFKKCFKIKEHFFYSLFDCMIENWFSILQT